ncbi:hypothetical protein HYT33_04350 [Candidatus Roizmanbacteria bacterium]|nr:hypothetical protein [Candidatus Roizmanbacteria bacterium]
MFFRKTRAKDNRWFFTELPWYIQVFGFFIKGDLIVLFPLLVLIIFTGFISVQFMVLLIGIYVAVRNLGEMIYWFSHQFAGRKYRPNDFGFKNLGNHAIYILYQTLSIAGVMIGIAIMLYVLLFL